MALLPEAVLPLHEGGTTAPSRALVLTVLPWCPPVLPRPGDFCPTCTPRVRFSVNLVMFSLIPMLSPLAFTAAAGSRGGYKRAAKRTRNEDQAEEVISSSNMTHRQWSILMSTKASKHQSITNMPDEEFRKNRRTNPYVKPQEARTNECLDRKSVV